jgi:hypothetical protein
MPHEHEFAYTSGHPATVPAMSCVPSGGSSVLEQIRADFAGAPRKAGTPDAVSKAVDAASPQANGTNNIVGQAFGQVEANRKPMTNVANFAMVDNMAKVQKLIDRASGLGILGAVGSPTPVSDYVARSIGLGAVGKPSTMDLIAKSAGLGAIGRPSGVQELIAKSAGLAATGPGSMADAIGRIVNPMGQPGMQAMLGTIGFAGPMFDATAFRSPLERAIGSTNLAAFREVAHGFEVPAPLVVPNDVGDPVAQVFAALRLELDASNIAARRAFMQGYAIASRYRYSTPGRWVAWAVGIIGASTGLYGTVVNSDAAIIAGAIGVLVAVCSFPEAKPQD